MTTINEIIRAIDVKTEIFQLADNTACVIDKVTFKLRRAWQQKNGEFEEIDINKMIARIATKLKDKVDTEALLREWLVAKAHPQFLLELDTRLQKQAKVRSLKSRCYSLSIGGTVGRPIELCLVNNQGSDE